jgi:drug/metabolite transporter (DMT)-like permease
MNLRGFSALLAGIILFSTIEVASKLMQIGGGVAGHYPFWLACLRFMIAGLILLFPALRYLRRRRVVLQKRDLYALAGLGLLGVTLMSSLYHLSITFLPANVAALVFSCNPVLVVLFAPLVLSEKITLRKLVAGMLCLAGTAVLARGRADSLSAAGLLLMLTATAIFALYTVLFKKMTPRCGALPVTALASLFGGIFELPLALGVEGFPLAAYGGADWICLIYLAVIGTALAYFFFIYGMGHVEAGIGSMAFFLKPFLAALFAWMVLGEALTIPMLIGGAFILGGMITALGRSRSG